MGGNLFKLGRLERSKYLKLEQELRIYLEAKFGEHYRIPKYYHQKPDFGDMDILISSAGMENWDATKAKLIEDLGIEEHKTIGSILSTVYQDFQVDFFHCNEQNFLSTYHFLSWNDVGNLLGKMFRRFNLKYGEKGLLYVFRRADNHYKKDLLVSQDMRKIIEFLKLSYETWKEGFETLDDIYKWVISSPYFSVQPYLGKDDVRIQKRVRQKRTTVERFIKFLEQNQIEKHYSHPEDKDSYLPDIAAYFPEAKLLERIEEERQREAYVNAIKAKFNGKLIMTWFPDLKGKALGSFIQSFKDSIGTEQEFEALFYELSADEIKTRVLKFYEQNSLSSL